MRRRDRTQLESLSHGLSTFQVDPGSNRVLGACFLIFRRSRSRGLEGSTRVTARQRVFEAASRAVNARSTLEGTLTRTLGSSMLRRWAFIRLVVVLTASLSRGSSEPPR